MEDQGKRKSQMKDSETFAIIALIAALIAVLLMLSSCGTKAQETPQEEDSKVYLDIDGYKVELVADEYGNQYLKEITRAGWIFIPYEGDVEETDSLKFFNAKNK